MTIIQSSFRVKISGMARRFSAVALPVVLVFATQAFPQSGKLLREYWNGISGSGVSSLTGNGAYPNSPSGSGELSLFEGPTNTADNFGVRIRGYVIPPTTGSYTFWIASDDCSELWLSTDSTSVNKSLIASVNGYTNSREWTKYSSQQSSAISLTANRKYYVEVLHKEAGGNDNIAVGWQGPGISGDAERPIPANRLYKFQPPSITTQPSNQTVNLGQTATFSVATTGSALSYQWRKGSTNISGATSASYTTPATVSTDNGAVYSCVITNGAESVTSNNAILTVNEASATTYEMENLTPNSNVSTLVESNLEFSNGQSVKISGNAVGDYCEWTIPSVAAGTYNVTFFHKSIDNRAIVQASFNGTNLGSPVDMYGAAVYQIPADLGTYTFSSSGNKTFRLTVTGKNAASTGYSMHIDKIKLTQNGLNPPVITTQPSNQTVTETQTATFSVTASGGALTYQWKKNGTNIPGATNSTYTTPATTVSDNLATFCCVVTNTGGSVTSNNATLYVNYAAPVITQQPGDATVPEGASATFIIAATGSGTISYQWRKNGANIGGATSSTYTTPATSKADSGAIFSCVVTNPPGNASVSSNNATLHVTMAAPVITTQPTNQTVAVGDSATFTLSASGSGTLTYQWKKNGADVSGATAPSYTTPPATKADSGAAFTCIVSNLGGSVTSSAALLIVLDSGGMVFVYPEVCGPGENMKVDGVTMMGDSMDTAQDSTVMLKLYGSLQTGGHIGISDGSTNSALIKGDLIQMNKYGGGMSLLNTITIDNTIPSIALTGVGYSGTTVSASKIQTDTMNGVRYGSIDTLSVASLTLRNKTIDTDSLYINGVVEATSFKVGNWVLDKTPDYVFSKNYNLLSLKDLETYIAREKHLPQIPSAAQMRDNGVDIAEMNMMLLKKIEELTLYILQQQKVIEGIKNEKLKIKNEKAGNR